MAYSCTCSPKGHLVTDGCKYICTACGHPAGMHAGCRGRCLEGNARRDCKCVAVQGVPWPEPRKPNPERDRDIVARRDRGETYTSIAKVYDICPERARSIALREYFKRGIKLLRDPDEELRV
jgi:hypothetical protein